MSATATMDQEQPGVFYRIKKIFQYTGWIIFALFCLVFFTLIKLPEARIKNYIQGTLSSLAAQRGMTVRPKETNLSILTGIRYEMNNVKVTTPKSATPIKISRIQVSPNLLPGLLGKLSSDFLIENRGGKLDGTSWSKDSQFGLEAEAHQLDLGKLGLFEILGKISGGAVLDGDLEIEGDSRKPQTVSGETNLNLKKILIQEQSFMGFSIPAIRINTGRLKTRITKGKMILENVKIGEIKSKKDDLALQLKGSVQLGKQLEASVLDVEARFRISDQVKKSFVLLDALLGAGKQKDGSYAFKLTGPLYRPQHRPIR